MAVTLKLKVLPRLSRALRRQGLKGLAEFLALRAMQSSLSMKALVGETAERDHAEGTRIPGESEGGRASSMRLEVCF